MKDKLFTNLSSSYDIIISIDHITSNELCSDLIMVIMELKKIILKLTITKIITMMQMAESVMV